MTRQISRLDIEQYTIPFRKPIVMMGQEMTERLGFYVSIQVGDSIGRGEIAPFPSLHEESLTECYRQLLDAKSYLTDEIIPANVELLSGEMSAWLDRYNFSPSVRFGLETAVLNTLPKANSVLWQNNRPYISLNGLATGSLDEITTQVEQQIEQGFKAIKLKVGRLPIPQEIALLEQLHHRFPTIQWRPDANRAWSWEDAVTFCNAISHIPIEYIEEPLQQPERLAKLYQLTAVPLALDESIQGGMSPESVDIWKGLQAIVLKPSTVGGVEMCWQWRNWGLANGIQIVISSAFQNGIGLEMSARLASCMNVVDVPAGLNTAVWFAEPTDPIIPIQYGKMKI